LSFHVLKRKGGAILFCSVLEDPHIDIIPAVTCGVVERLLNDAIGPRFAVKAAVIGRAIIAYRAPPYGR
jgi:hypothetical protein